MTKRYRAVCLTAGCGLKTRPSVKRTARAAADIHAFKWAHRIVVRPTRRSE